MIRVLIVDDQKSVQEILKNYVENDPGLEVVACAGNGKKAIELVEVYQPHVVLMDIEMPVMDGLPATQIITEKFINTKVLIITVHNDDSYLNSALQVGAKGYLKKNTPEKELINAIYSAHKGYFQLGPGFLERYLYNTALSHSNSQEIEKLKNVMFQQSMLLDDLNNGGSKTSFNGTGASLQNDNITGTPTLEDRYNALEKHVYYMSSRIERLKKQVNLNQQLFALAIICNVFFGVLLVIYII